MKSLWGPYVVVNKNKMLFGLAAAGALGYLFYKLYHKPGKELIQDAEETAKDVGDEVKKTARKAKGKAQDVAEDVAES